MSSTKRQSVQLRRLTCASLLVLCAIGCEVPGGLTMRQRDSEEDLWAIRCRTLREADRVRLARNYAEALKKVTGIRPELVQVFHEADESVVYYGRYRRTYNAKTRTETFRPNHLRDLDLIRHLSVNVNDALVGTRTAWPFQLATMDTLPTGRGTHTEWLLSNAPGYWSLQVAVFYNTENMRRRKYAAEEYCRLLRAQGHAAYYHHGPTNSSVCIGSFPEEAIQTYQHEDAFTGVIRVRSRIVDKRMLELQKRFPDNLHNGYTVYERIRDPRTGESIRDPHTSFAVEIPRNPQGVDSFSE